MSNTTLTSARQIVSRDILQEIFPYVPGQLLDELLRSIDRDLTVPLRADASSSPNLVITIGPAIVNNTVSGRQKSIPHVNNIIPTFTSGTITLPSSDTGTITVSPGASPTLNCPSGDFNKILVSLDSTGNLVLTQGTPNSLASNVAVPSPVTATIPICYFIVSNISGTIQPVVQNQIFQIAAGGGGSGGSSPPIAGFAQEVPISLGITSITVTFPSDLPGLSYIVQANFANYTDANPDFQPITITNKTISGFTAVWNAPTDTSNYFLDYIVPVVQVINGEVPVSLGDTSAIISLPYNFGGIAYSVVAGFVNIVDGSPQFQPIEIVGKTTTNFTLKWNAGCDSANYRVAYILAQYQ